MLTSPTGEDVFVAKIDPSGRTSSIPPSFGGNAIDKAWGIDADADGEFNDGIAVHEPSRRTYVASRADTTNLPAIGAFSANCPNGPCYFVVGFTRASR